MGWIFGGVRTLDIWYARGHINMHVHLFYMMYGMKSCKYNMQVCFLNGFAMGNHLACDCSGM